MRAQRRNQRSEFYDDEEIGCGETARTVFESEQHPYEYLPILDQYGEQIKRPRERVPFGFVR